MKVAFDISQTGKDKAGCGYLADSLAQELARSPLSETMIYLRTFGPDWWYPANQELVVPGAPEDAAYRAGFAAHGESIAFWGGPPEAIRAALGAPDIIHSNNFYSPPALAGTKQVYTLHDMSVFEVPQYTTEENRISCGRNIVRAADRADFVIANSHYTKANFLEYFNYPKDRVAVIPLGSRFDPDTFALGGRAPAQLDPERAFILCVGTIEPRKNYDGVIAAFRRIVASRDVDLVIVGKLGWHMDAFSTLVVASGLAERIHLLSYVDDQELRWLYRRSKAFLYPSHFEGFGMPVLEAMSQGCAVVASNTTSIPEVAGDAALLVPPDDDQAIASALTMLLDNRDLRDQLRFKAKIRAMQFTWSNGARIVQDVYAQLAEEIAREAAC